jgi:hypothetical protein
MRRIFAFVALACVATLPVLAVAAAPGPPGMKRLDLKHENIVVFYPAAAATPLDHAPAWTSGYRDAGVYVDVPLLLALGKGAPKLALACDSGGSNDPSCRLLTNADDADSVVFESPGNRFVFRATGEIEVSGATDFMYDHRRLFRLDGVKWKEVAQPFRYVGIDGRTKAALTLTVTPHSLSADVLPIPIATLPAGTPLTILLNAAAGDDENGQNPDYLVKTREGIVGWANIPQHADGTSDVEGLTYSGD